jgi:hypothetical protein
VIRARTVQRDLDSECRTHEKDIILIFHCKFEESELEFPEVNKAHTRCKEIIVVLDKILLKPFN